MITSELKDKILNYLWNNKGKDYRIDVDYYNHKLCEELNVDMATLQQLIEYFERKRLLIGDAYKGGNDLTMKIETHDFLVNGGFVVEDEIINKNLNKLNLEIKGLESSIPKGKFDIITTSIATILATWTAVHGK